MLNQLAKFEKTAVVTIPTMHDSDWNFLQSLRKSYDFKGYAYIDPHFTLLSTNQQYSKQELSNILRTNLIEQKEIHFVIRTALFMPPLIGHKSWYIFLIPDQGFSELTELHRHIYAAGLQLPSYKKFPFIPHITVGSFKHKAECLQVVEAINKNKFELTGHIKKVSLIEENNNSAQIYDQILLGR